VSPLSIRTVSLLDSQYLPGPTYFDHVITPTQAAVDYFKCIKAPKKTQETDCLCSLPNIHCPWPDRMTRFASATVFVFSFVTKGLPSKVDRSESCLEGACLGYGCPADQSRLNLGEN
jgi:hypothetical protein